MKTLSFPLFGVLAAVVFARADTISVRHAIGRTALSAEDWGTIVFYNGSGGCGSVSIPGHGSILTPWKFLPQISGWIFHDNENDYADKVRKELEGEFPTRE